jgi:hypothetical protein
MAAKIVIDRFITLPCLFIRCYLVIDAIRPERGPIGGRTNRQLATRPVAAANRLPIVPKFRGQRKFAISPAHRQRPPSLDLVSLWHLRTIGM